MGARRVERYWPTGVNTLIPTRNEDAAAKDHHDRRFDLSQSFAGTWIGDLFLDSVSVRIDHVEPYAAGGPGVTGRD